MTVRKFGQLGVLWIMGAAVFVGAVSCSRPGENWSEYRQLPSEGWAFGDTVSFLPQHPDSLTTVRLVVALRHDGTYPFTEAAIELTAGKGSIRDTLRLRLADPSGRWLGKGIGTTFQVADTVTRRLRHRSGSPVTLRQVMRTDTLRGIDRIGLFLVPAP